MKWFFTSVVALAVLASPLLVSAQITQQAAPQARPERSDDPVVTDTDSEHYAIRFGDDLLAAALEDGHVPQLKIRAVKSYGLLIRPRLHFVPELFKSVEWI